MPPPAPIKCPAPDCATQYQTPDNLPTYELVTTHLQMHIATNHALAPAAPGLHVPQPGQVHPQTSKVDKRSRPEVTQDMSEHNFRFFESEWNLYKRATGIQGQTLVDELWSCMSSDLKKLAFDQGSIDSLNTEDLMMARIKSLAVAVLHTAIHTVHLHEAKQISDETTKAFATQAVHLWAAGLIPRGDCVPRGAGRAQGQGVAGGLHNTGPTEQHQRHLLTC